MVKTIKSARVADWSDVTVRARGERDAFLTAWGHKAAAALFGLRR